ncbi:MAG: hypothetical protein ACD_75C01846G0002 [uncultured bacterium]|nr:MAG: hypothetical protein ACD_75C01846G0002 [uncultured bacterium]
MILSAVHFAIAAANAIEQGFFREHTMGDIIMAEQELAVEAGLAKDAEPGAVGADQVLVTV